MTTPFRVSTYVYLTMFAFIKFCYIAHTNAEAIYQQPSPQQVRQGQGRGGTPQNMGKPTQSGKYLPPSKFDIQPQSMQEYNTAGTNAVVLRHHQQQQQQQQHQQQQQQQQQQHDRFYADRQHNEQYGQGRYTGPVSLDSYKAKHGYNNANFPHPQQPQHSAVRSEQPPQGQAEHYVSEGINEEIRHQADYQRHQNQQDLEFTSQLPLDPYLICPNCKKQFREGQLPEYRRHIDSCRL